MSSEPEASFARTADRSLPWPQHASAYSTIQEQQFPGYSSFPSGANSELSTSYPPHLAKTVEMQLAQLRAAHPGYPDDQLLRAIYPSSTPSPYTHLSQQPNVYTSTGSTLESALAFSPATSLAASTISAAPNSTAPLGTSTSDVASSSSNVPVATSTRTSNPESPISVPDDPSTPPDEADLAPSASNAPAAPASNVSAAPAPAVPASSVRTSPPAKSPSPPAKSQPKPSKKAKVTVLDDGLWSKLKPHLSRHRLERDPAVSAREMVGLLSETDSDGRFRKPVSTNRELREAIVQSLLSVATLEKGKGYTETGRRKFLGAWVASPAGRQLLANWLRQAVPPKKGSDGADLSKTYKATLMPLLIILDHFIMQHTYLTDASGLAKAMTGVVLRATDPAALKLATQIRDRWVAIHDKADSKTTSSASKAKADSPVTSNTVPVAKRKAAESSAETSKRYKAATAAPAPKPAAAPAKPGLSFFASASAKPAVPKKPAPVSRGPSKPSAHQSIQALMNTVIGGDQKDTSAQGSNTAGVAKRGSVKKVKKVSWRDDADLVAVRWIESRDDDQERHGVHIDFEHEGAALKIAVSTMEEQISWYKPRPLNLPHGPFPSGEESVEGPYQTQRNARQPSASNPHGEDSADADDGQLNLEGLTSPAPPELFEPTKEIFLPSAFLPADDGNGVSDSAMPDEESLSDSTEASVPTAEDVESVPLPEASGAEESGPTPPQAQVVAPGPPLQGLAAAAPVPPPHAPAATESAPAVSSDVAALLAKVKGLGARLAEDGKGSPTPSTQLDMDLLQSILQNAKSANGTNGSSASFPGHPGPPPLANIASLLQNVRSSGLAAGPAAYPGHPGPPPAANISSLLQNYPQGNPAQMGVGQNWQQPYVQPATMPVSSYPGEYNEDYLTPAQHAPTPTQPFHHAPQQPPQGPKVGQSDNNPAMNAYIQARLHTKPCKYHASGKCWRGDNCNFLHS